jgi:hypothetical protein
LQDEGSPTVDVVALATVHGNSDSESDSENDSASSTISVARPAVAVQHDSAVDTHGQRSLSPPPAECLEGSNAHLAIMRKRGASKRIMRIRSDSSGYTVSSESSGDDITPAANLGRRVGMLQAPRTKFSAASSESSGYTVSTESEGEKGNKHIANLARRPAIVQASSTKFSRTSSESSGYTVSSESTGAESNTLGANLARRFGIVYAPQTRIYPASSESSDCTASSSSSSSDSEEEGAGKDSNFSWAMEIDMSQLDG